MDCPKPIQMETKKDKNLKTKKSKKFNTKSEDGKTYEIEMGLSEDSIIFKSEINNGIVPKTYSSIYSFDKLKQNKIFTLQEDIEEIYDQIEIYIDEEPVTIDFKGNNIIGIKILTKVKKSPEINFELKEEIVNDKEIINILIDKISSLEKKVNNLESENKSLKEDLKEIKEYINEQKEKERKKKLKFVDSLIVKEDERQMICDWINPNVNIKTKLLYRVSRDGDGADIFHKYCDNKGPTITFAKISNGYRFGGYSGISWTSQGNWVKDKDAFLFSLNNKLKIMNNNTNTTVYHGSGYGPDFGNGAAELLLNNSYKCLTGKHNFCNDSYSGFTFKNKDLVGVDTKGQYNFDVEDYEVYSIII